MFPKILRLLNPQEKTAAIRLFILILISTVLETLGVGLILPFLTLLVDPKAGADIAAFTWAREALGLEGHVQVVIAALVALLAFFIAKNSFLAWVAWSKAGFIADCYTRLSDRLFAGYLNRPYAFHLNRNSSELIRTITSDSSQFTSVLTALAELGTQGLLLLSVGILLFWIEPLGTAATVVLATIASGLLHKFGHSKLERWGQERQVHDAVRLRYLQEGFTGVKEIKIAAKEAHFLEVHARKTAAVMRIERLRTFTYQVPKLYFEVLAMAAMVALILSMLYQGKRLETLVPTLALFGAASFRLLPTLNSFIGALQSLRFHKAAVDLLDREIREEEVQNRPNGNGPAVDLRDEIRLADVSYSYPNADNAVVANLSIAIPARSTAGLIGESGAGKSTIIDLVLGLLTPASGRILVDGRDIRENIRSWQEHIGYVPQTIFLSDDTLRRNIALGIPDDRIDQAAVLQAIQAAQLDQLVAKLPDGIDTLLGERGVRLSGGERQRVGMARALYRDPSVLVLDEATSALDMETERSVMDAVTALHGTRTIIIVAHRLSTLAGCDKVFRLQQGSVASEGTYEEVVGGQAA